MTKPDPELTKAHVAATARLYGSGERWPSVAQEVWLARRLGDATFAEGVTSAEERRERLRRRIVESGRAGEHIGRSAVDGTELTFAAMFERLYGVPL